MKTYLEYKDEKSAKFWQVEVTKNTHTITYGKIGTDGRSNTKTFDTEEEAQKDSNKLIAKKTKKGYTDKEAGKKDKGTKMEGIKESLMKFLQADGYTLEESIKDVNESKIQIKKDVINITYSNGTVEILKIKDGVVSFLDKDENNTEKIRIDTTKFRKLTNQELLEYSKYSEHGGIKDYLKEMGEGGLENYNGKFLFHEGNLEVKSSFDFNQEDENITVLIVKGDMMVSELFRDYCHDGPSCTIILGNLYAKNAIIAGYLEVNDMNIKEAVVGDYNDGGAIVKGDLKCTLFFPLDIGFQIVGKNFAKESTKYSYKQKPTCLKKAYFKDQHIDIDKIFKDLKVGKSIIK